MSQIVTLGLAPHELPEEALTQIYQVGQSSICPTPASVQILTSVASIQGGG